MARTEGWLESVLAQEALSLAVMRKSLEVCATQMKSNTDCLQKKRKQWEGDVEHSGHTTEP